MGTLLFVETTYLGLGFYSWCNYRPPSKDFYHLPFVISFRGAVLFMVVSLFPIFGFCLVLLSCFFCYQNLGLISVVVSGVSVCCLVKKVVGALWSCFIGLVFSTVLYYILFLCMFLDNGFNFSLFFCFTFSISM